LPAIPAGIPNAATRNQPGFVVNQRRRPAGVTKPVSAEIVAQNAQAAKFYAASRSRHLDFFRATCLSSLHISDEVGNPMILPTRIACIVSIGSLWAALALSPALAQTVKSQTEAADPTTIDSVAQSLENTAHSLEKNGGLRGSNTQWHSPANSTEYRALARYVPILVVTVSQDESELPLKRVYVDANGSTTELQRISSTRSVDPKSFTSKILGRYRQTAYYLMPVALLSSEGKLVADFMVHRTGYQLAVLTDKPIDYVQSDNHPLPTAGDSPDRSTLRDFVKRHFQDIPLQD
jgi:hypothetical protein